MHPLADRLWQSIRRQGLLRPGDRCAVAVSAGADSVALLRLMLELRASAGIVLSVVHVNHKLRAAESDADQEFVEALAREHELECLARTAQVAPGSGVEARARRLRYECFGRLAGQARIAKVATAHTLDDQAETVLMRMLRGTGLRGLAGILPRLPLTEGVEVVRPLLAIRRDDLLSYLRDRGQVWREDASNRDPAFLRNRVRHDLLPRMEKDFGPAVPENLADLAEIARAEEEHWSAHPEIRPEAHHLALTGFSSLALAAQRRTIRAWLDANQSPVSFRVVERVREMALGPAGNTLELAFGLRLRRAQRELRLETGSPADYAYRLAIPGAVDVPELGIRVEATLVDAKSLPDDLRRHALDAARTPPEVVVRNWRAGDRFWPAHTRAAKKVKDLLGDRHIVGPAKASWPLAVDSAGCVLWMRGFPAPQEAAAGNALRAVCFRVIDAASTDR